MERETCNCEMGLLPSTTVYCDQYEAPAKDNEISQHPLLGGQALRFNHIGRIVMELAKFTDKMNEIHNHVKIINPEIKWGESLFVSVSI